MDFDDITYETDKHMYVWVKPANSMSWNDILDDDRISNRGDEYRPAKIIGRLPEPEYRGTQVDGRRIELIGSPYAYSLEKFELGGELVFEDTLSLKL
jgi:hypothetical protein